MTLEQTDTRSTNLAQVPVRVVDSDIHPVPRAGEMAQFIPEPWRSKYIYSHKTGDTINYDAPDYAYAHAMRTDSFPSDGNFAGSDPDLALKHVIMEGGS